MLRMEMMQRQIIAGLLQSKVVVPPVQTAAEICVVSDEGPPLQYRPPI